MLGIVILYIHSLGYRQLDFMGSFPDSSATGCWTVSRYYGNCKIHSQVDSFRGVSYLGIMGSFPGLGGSYKRNIT